VRKTPVDAAASCLKSFYLGTVLANPFINPVAACDRDAPEPAATSITADDVAAAGIVAARTDVLQTVVATVSASDEEDSDGTDVHAQMYGSESGSGLARDDVKPGDTMQESRPAHLATAPSDSFDCIGEIFAGHAKSDRRFTLNAAKFELALIDPPPLRNVA
jgi:hypothetical protein